MSAPFSLPTPGGVNVTETVQNAAAARLPPQVFALIAKLRLTIRCRGDDWPVLRDRRSLAAPVAMR